MTRTRSAIITGTGMYVPPDIYTNKDLEKMMETSDEWIQERSGIRERRYAKDGVGCADLGIEAARLAMARAKVGPDDIDLIIFSTLTPDYYFPGSGVFIQEKLGSSKPIPALDIRNQCSGFLYGLSVARAMVLSEQYKRVLFICAEVHSHAINLSTAGRDVSVLFGDGAGAVIIEGSKEAERGIISVHLHSDGAHKDVLKIEAPSIKHWPMMTAKMIEEGMHWPKMEGRHVYKHAVKRMPEVVNEALTANKIDADDIDLFLFHQANLRINEAVMQQMEQPLSKSYNNIDRYGNCSSASIPICLDECVRSGRIKKGDLICMSSFGAGFTWGSAIMRW